MDRFIVKPNKSLEEIRACNRMAEIRRINPVTKQELIRSLSQEIDRLNRELGGLLPMGRRSDILLQIKQIGLEIKELSHQDNEHPRRGFAHAST